MQEETQRRALERRSSHSVEISGVTQTFPVSLVVVASWEAGDGPRLFRLSSLRHSAVAPSIVYTSYLHELCVNVSFFSLFLSFFPGAAECCSPPESSWTAQ